MKKTKTLFCAITAALIFLLTACSSAPEERVVKNVVINYFELKGYTVVHLDIAEIRPMPMGEKQYMGTPGFDVVLRSITLEIKDDADEKWSLEKGKQHSFSNGIIRIKKRTGPVKDWIIVNISGIPVL